MTDCILLGARRNGRRVLLKMDKTAFSVGRLSDEGDEKAYWLSKSPQERVEAIEVMRRIVYGGAATSGRLQRVLEVARREQG